MRLRLSTFLVFLFLAACAATPPTNDNRSEVDRYDVYPAPAALPIAAIESLKSKKPTHLQGYFMENSEPFPMPLKHANFQLIKDNQIVLESSTDSSGRFDLNAPLELGDYQIKLTKGAWKLASLAVSQRDSETTVYFNHL